MTNFDDLITTVGELGRYQLFVYFLLCIAAIPDGLQVNLGVFLTPIIEFRCAIPGVANDVYKPGNTDPSLNRSVPQFYDAAICRNVSSRCHAYGDNSTIIPCDRWVFDKSTFSSTATEDYEMVCDWAVARTFTMMAPMVGMLFGSVISGTLADRYGRKKIFLITNTLGAIFGVAASWSPDLGYFTFSRVIVPALTTGMYFSAIVLAMELVGPSKRMGAGIVLQTFWALSVTILAGLAYVIRDWHTLQLAVSLPSLMVVVYIWLIPESPRWLLAKGRHDDAMRVMEKIARHNNTEIPQRFYDVGALKNVSKDIELRVEKVWKMFSSTRLALRSTIIIFNWMAVMLTYYGLLLYAGSFSENTYLNMFLGGLVEFPAYLLCFFFLDRIGRRTFHSGSAILSGVACLSSIFAILFFTRKDCEISDSKVFTLVICLIGRFWSSASFGSILVYTSELFPTTIRNGAIGVSSMAARIGGICAPYVVSLKMTGSVGEAFPLLLMGGSTLIAGLLSLLLPETHGIKLPDTIQEAESFGRTRVGDGSEAELLVTEENMNYGTDSISTNSCPKLMQNSTPEH